MTNSQLVSDDEDESPIWDISSFITRHFCTKPHAASCPAGTFPTSMSQPSPCPKMHPVWLLLLSDLTPHSGHYTFWQLVSSIACQLERCDGCRKHWPCPGDWTNDSKKLWQSITWTLALFIAWMTLPRTGIGLIWRMSKCCPTNGLQQDFMCHCQCLLHLPSARSTAMKIWNITRYPSAME